MEHDSETKYLERYAKELLEQLFPDKYKDIEIYERPDLLMGPDYGIEVTWAMFENQGQAGGILNHVKGQNIDQIDRRYQQTMKRINADFLIDQDKKIIGYNPAHGNEITYQELLAAYNRKRKKCSNYNKKYIDLFIYPPLAQIDGWLGENVIESFFSIIHNECSNPFHNIIVYEEPTLYLFSVEDNQTQISRGSSTIIERCKKIAYDYSGWGQRNREDDNSEQAESQNTNKKPSLFISYNHQSSRNTAKKLVERLEGVVDVIWDERLAPWKSFGDFMDSIRKQDFVVAVISDRYLKSINCMYEMMQLMNEELWNKKSMFILEDSAKGIYCILTRVKYIDYWANEEQRYLTEQGKHDPAARNELTEARRKCGEIKVRICDFLKVIADLNNPPVDKAIEAVVERMKISAKRSSSNAIEIMILSLIQNGVATAKEISIATNRTEDTIKRYLRNLLKTNRIESSIVDKETVYNTK